MWQSFSDRAASGETTKERQIATTDKQIDALVNGLYGLTEKEIKIVEGGVKPRKILGHSHISEPFWA